MTFKKIENQDTKLAVDILRILNMAREVDTIVIQEEIRDILPIMVYLAIYLPFKQMLQY
jgi:hypothetical protein